MPKWWQPIAASVALALLWFGMFEPPEHQLASPRASDPRHDVTARPLHEPGADTKSSTLEGRERVPAATDAFAAEPDPSLIPSSASMPASSTGGGPSLEGEMRANNDTDLGNRFDRTGPSVSLQPKQHTPAPSPSPTPAPTPVPPPSPMASASPSARPIPSPIVVQVDPMLPCD